MDRLQRLYDAAPTVKYPYPVGELGIEGTLNEIHVMLSGLIDVRIAELEEEEVLRHADST
jgi:hypothetical protein